MQWPHTHRKQAMCAGRQVARGLMIVRGVGTYSSDQSEWRVPLSNYIVNSAIPLPKVSPCLLSNYFMASLGPALVAALEWTVVLLFRSSMYRFVTVSVYALWTSLGVNRKSCAGLAGRRFGSRSFCFPFFLPLCFFSLFRRIPA